MVRPVQEANTNTDLQRIPAAGQGSGPYDAHEFQQEMAGHAPSSQGASTDAGVQQIAAVGQGADPYDAHTFQQGMAGHAPSPVAGVHFPTLSSPEESRIGHQNAQFIQNLYANSPTFHNTLNTATQGGRQPIDVHYGQTPGGDGGLWRPNERRVTIDPHHLLRQAGPGGIHGTTSFELVNASGLHGQSQIATNAASGHYERMAAHINGQNPNQRPVTPGELFGRDAEYHEWQNVKIHHQSMTEAKAAGMPLLPGSDRVDHKFGDDPGHSGSWENFENYHNQMKETGHTQHYVDQYYQRYAPSLRPQQAGLPPR